MKVNDEVFPLQSDNTISVESSESGYYAVFPSSNTIVGQNISVSIPAAQSYEVSGGKQKINAPMVGFAPQGSSNITMRNLCSLVKVTVKQPSDKQLTVLAIKVESLNSTKLSGQVGVTMNADGSILSSTAPDGGNLVTLGGIYDDLNDNPYKEGSYYLYIPNGEDHKLKFTISCRDNNNFQLISYTRSFSEATAIARNTITNVNAAVGQSGWASASEGFGFSVASSKRVTFAPGNLEYNGGSNEWRIAQSPVNFIKTWNTSSWVGHFGWGTWAQSPSSIVLASNNSDDYDWGMSDSAQIDVSWVVDNGSCTRESAYNSSNWRLPTGDEWQYVLFTRNASTVDGVANARFARATVCGVKGLILFPDVYVHPQVSCDFSNRVNAIQSFFNAIVVNAEDWQLMESAGCIFLPSAGYRDGVTIAGGDNQSGGRYNSSTCQSDGKCSFLFYDASSCQFQNGARYFGRSIRLVKDMNI